MSALKAAQPRMRAVIYTRVSTEDQVKNTSLDEQTRLCTAEANHRGWEIVGEYQDAGISGTRRDRPAWQRMLADARDGKIDRLLVLNLSRFSRNSGDTITQSRALLELGVSLVSVQESFDVSSPSGRAMLGMQAIFWEFDREQIVTKTVAGQRAKAANGGRPGGEPPYGWKVAGKDKSTYLVPNEPERETLAEAVHCLLRRHLNIGQIADHLNALGMRPRKAPKWNPDVLRRMLTNPTLYTGKSWWGAKESGALYPRSHHTRLDRNGEPVHGDPIEIVLPEPPLTLAQHRAIIRAIERRSTRGKSATAKSQMLTTRIVGACGQHYIGVSLKEKDDIYRCSGRKHIKGADKCSCKQVNGPTIDARVWAEVVGLLGSPERLEAMARQWLEVPEDADLDDVAPVIARLDKEIASTRRALERARTAQFKAEDPDEQETWVEKFRAELADLTDRRSGYAAMQAATVAKAERLTDLAQLAARAAGRLESLPESARREIIEILDIRVSMIGEVVTRMPERISEPEGIRIRGRIDPRLFGDGEAENRSEDAGPQPDFPDAQKSSGGEG
jgi:site-specific DNA recombinase